MVEELSLKNAIVPRCVAVFGSLGPLKDMLHRSNRQTPIESLGGQITFVDSLLTLELVYVPFYSDCEQSGCPHKQSTWMTRWVVGTYQHLSNLQPSVWHLFV